jgi:hypothetical protein
MKREEMLLIDSKSDVRGMRNVLSLRVASKFAGSAWKR